MISGTSPFSVTPTVQCELVGTIREKVSGANFDLTVLRVQRVHGWLSRELPNIAKRHVLVDPVSHTSGKRKKVS